MRPRERGKDCITSWLFLVNGAERCRRPTEREWSVLEGRAAVLSGAAAASIACWAHTPSLSLSEIVCTVGKCRLDSQDTRNITGHDRQPAAQLSRTAPGRPSHFDSENKTSNAFSSRGTSARSPANDHFGGQSANVDRLSSRARSPGSRSPHGRPGADALRPAAARCDGTRRHTQLILSPVGTEATLT